MRGSKTSLRNNILKKYDENFSDFIFASSNFIQNKLNGSMNRKKIEHTWNEYSHFMNRLINKPRTIVVVYI